MRATSFARKATADAKRVRVLAKVRRDLSRSHLSIHLIGAKSAVVPEEAEDKTIVCLQNELAADYGQQNTSHDLDSYRH